MREGPGEHCFESLSNVRESHLPFRASQLSAPLDDGKPKRRRTQSQEPPSKRSRMMAEHSSNDVDVGMEEVTAILRRGRRRSAFQILGLTSRGYPRMPPRILLPSCDILQSFVSSRTSDVFKCHSRDINNFLTPPYACAYSTGAKNAGAPLLAVATEQGSLHILNTAKRTEWDPEPSRVTLEPHDNGIFDVKWSADDTLLATASGDKSTKVSSVETQQLLFILKGHTSTVKCVSWDPTHRDLLVTGGRDGMLCLYDLRVKNFSNEDGSEIPARTSVITITAAHGQEKAQGGRKKLRPLPRGVTNIVYPDDRPHGIVSSGSFDGILHYWDLRLPSDKAWKRSPEKSSSKPLYSSPVDPTTFSNARGRGIISMCQGTGPSAGLLYALGADSRLYTYSQPTLSPLRTENHLDLKTNSFYVRLATSPCGRWLASGSAGKPVAPPHIDIPVPGVLFLFDISNTGRVTGSFDVGGEPLSPAIRLCGQCGEIGAVDWARDMVASCADDGTVRIWRPDVDVYRNCIANSKEQEWQWFWSV